MSEQKKTEDGISGLLDYSDKEAVKELSDKIKIEIFNILIDLSEKQSNCILTEQLVYIRDEVDKIRKKDREDKSQAIVDAMDSIIRRGIPDKLEDGCGGDVL